MGVRWSGCQCRAQMVWGGPVGHPAPFEGPWNHLHDNAVAVEVGGGLGNLSGSGGGRHVDGCFGSQKSGCLNKCLGRVCWRELDDCDEERIKYLR